MKYFFFNIWSTIEVLSTTAPSRFFLIFVHIAKIALIASLKLGSFTMSSFFGNAPWSSGLDVVYNSTTFLQDSLQNVFNTLTIESITFVVYANFFSHQLNYRVPLHLPDMFKIRGTVYIFLATVALDFDPDVIICRIIARKGDITFSGGQCNYFQWKKKLFKGRQCNRFRWD